MAKGGSSAKHPPSHIATAWRRYDAGDIASARVEAKYALAKPASPQEAEQARDLLSRTGFPKIGIVMATVAALLLVLMVVLALLRG